MNPLTNLDVSVYRPERRSKIIPHVGLEVPSEARTGSFGNTLFEEPRPYIADDTNCMSPNNVRDPVEIKRIPTIEIQDYDSQAVLHGEGDIHGFTIKQEYQRSESCVGQTPGYPNMLHELSAFSKLENPDVNLPSPIEDLSSGSWDFLTPSLALSPSERSTSSRRTTISSVRSDSQTRHTIEGSEICPLRRCRRHTHGFVSSLDRNRHVISHFSDTIICAFCPRTMTFYRPDAFKRHLTVVHGAGQRDGHSWNLQRTTDRSDYRTPEGSNDYSDFGRCSTCTAIYSDVHDFFDHLDACFLNTVHQSIEKRNDTPSVSDEYTTDDEIVPDFGITTLRDFSNLHDIKTEKTASLGLEPTRLESDPERKDRVTPKRSGPLSPGIIDHCKNIREGTRMIDNATNTQNKSEQAVSGPSEPESTKEECSSNVEVFDQSEVVNTTAEPTSTPEYTSAHNWQSADDMTESPGSNDTESPFSGDETEWEDNQGDGNVYRELHMITHANILDATESGKSIIGPALSPLKRALIDRIMNEFWVVFNQGWTANITKHGDDSVSTISPNSPRNVSSTASNSTSAKKRSRNDREDSPSDETNDQPPKKPRPGVTSTRNGAQLIQLACPFRKHDPRKYGINQYRSCALSFWSSVGRVKEHLYRRHRIPIHCTRCWIRFKSQEEKDSHLNVVDICAIRCKRCELRFKTQDEVDSHDSDASLCAFQPGQEIEGISDEIERQLRSRKKSSRNPSQEDRWKDMYQLLFPDELVPTPYFEPIQDEAAQSPDSHDLAQYEEFSRRELPRFFRNCVEEAFKSEAQPLEERLLSRLFTMIQDCQDHVFASYRLQFVSTPIAESLVSTAIHGGDPSPHVEGLQPLGTGMLSLNPTSKCPSENILASVCPPPPPQIFTQPEPHQSTVSSRPSFQQLEQQKFSDSGYDSDTMLTCKCTDLCTCGLAQSPLESMAGPSRHQGQSAASIIEEHSDTVFDSGISDQWPFFIPPNPGDSEWDELLEVDDTLSIR